MKKIITLSLFALLNFSVFGQGQSGFTLETNFSLLNTNDLYEVENGIGYGFGLSSLESLYQSADWLFELSYTTQKITAKGYYDYYNNPIDFKDNQFSISNLNLNFVLNQYIIIPDLNKFHFGLQGGFGLNFFNDWKTKNQDNNFFYDRTNKFNSNYIVGISGGTEQLRATIRYYGALTNVFKDLSVGEYDDGSSSTIESREFIGKLGYISFSITYFTNLFQ